MSKFEQKTEIFGCLARSLTIRYKFIKLKGIKAIFGRAKRPEKKTTPKKCERCQHEVLVRDVNLRNSKRGRCKS